MEKTLILHVERKWFDKLDLGTKKIEYRWYNDYWYSRIMKQKEEMHTHVRFIEGYRKNARYLLFELIGVDVINDTTDLGKGQQFALNLGKLVMKGNLGD